MEYRYDTDTAVFQALRIYRNAFIAHCRSQLHPVFGEALDDEIKRTFEKEWDEVERSARQAFETGIVDRQPIDALDYLSVNHTFVLIEKYWPQLSPATDASGDTSRRQRAQLTGWARELIGVRNPVAHAPAEDLSLRDALRYVDSAARILRVLRLGDAETLRDMWSALVAEGISDEVAPPAVLDTLPSKEQITSDFVGREEHLADLWRWLGDNSRRIWALVGDGGKGKTTIAYEFASQSRSVLNEFGLQGVLWLSAKKRRFVEGEVTATTSPDFSDLDTALNWILISLGWTEELDNASDQKLRRCIELLDSFPMLIVADDIDSLDAEDEQAVEFFAHQIPQTRSKALLTSRRKVFGLGGCTTDVAGLSVEEVGELVRRRADSLELSPDQISVRLVRRIRDITDGSPLYIEDLLRLAHFFSLNQALDQWSGRGGDAAREYSMRRELEKLTAEAAAVLGVLAYAETPLSLPECAVVAGLTDDRAIGAMDELRNWNLLARPGLVEDVPRFTCSRNLAKLLKQTLAGSDEERRIHNALKGLRGIAFATSRVRGFIQQAVAQKQARQQDDAERTLLRGLSEVPNSGELHAMLGWLYSRWTPQARVVDAEGHFERAEALGSWGRDLYAHWADMELRRGEFRKAADICERSLKTAAKNDPFTWRLAGIAYTKQGQLLQHSLSTEQAADVFSRAKRALSKAQGLSVAVGDVSRTFNAHYLLARAMGDRDAAAEILREWEERLPADPYFPGVHR